MAKLDRYRMTGFKTVSMENDGTITEEGVMVNLVGSGQVGLGWDGAPIFGKALKLSGNLVTVQYDGFMVAEFSGAAPSPGSGLKMVLDGTGKIRSSGTGNGTTVDIVDVDTGSNEAAFLIRATGGE